MGSSTRKKKEKKKDFQKAKLKVGKAAPKPVNHTSTAFKAKSIVLKQQSLAVAAPSVADSFNHNLSLLTSKSESQRREALASLTNVVAATSPGEELPRPVSIILPKIEPTILDASQSVRTQLLRLLDALGTYDRNRRHEAGIAEPVSLFSGRVEKMLLYIIAALNHLSSSIRDTALDTLSWVVQIVPHDIVTLRGGFQKPLISLLTLLGWDSPAPPSVSAPSKRPSGWTAASLTPTITSTAESKKRVKVLNTMAQLLQAGLKPPPKDPNAVDPAVLCFPLRHGWMHNALPKRGAFDYLELFTPPAANRQAVDEDNTRLETQDERVKWFEKRREAVVRGAENAKKEGGDIGRAAQKVLAEIAF